MKLEDVVHTNVGGLRTACVTRKELVELICAQVESACHEAQVPLVIFDSNGHGISLANSNNDFMAAMLSADIIHADGQSVVSMSKWMEGSNIPERSATTDTIHDIPQQIQRSFRHFLLGGDEATVVKCGKILSQKYKNFEIAGTHHGYFDKEHSENVIHGINKANPDILWVGLGKPLEQQWIAKHKGQLNLPVIISCGGCYNYVTGDYARAPLWMQKSGLEWLHRAATEPKKFLWRYITTNPHSIFCVLKHKYKKSKAN